MSKDVRTRFSNEDLEKGERGGLFSINSPRLPSYPMRMIDRISELSDEGGEFGKGYALAEKDVTEGSWFFGCHFEGDPVMPGCLGLDGLWQLLGFYLGWLGFEGKGRAFGVGEVKFKNQVLPDSELLEFKIDIRKIITRPLVLAVADGLLRIDGQDGSIVKNMRVGLLPIS